MLILIAAVIMFFKRQYVFAGLFFGLSSLMKWQPLLVFPLFIATTINLQEGFKKSITNVTLLFIGFLPPVCAIWYAILSQPNGLEMFSNSALTLLYKAPYLSGQALNLNWIATYVLHILRPEDYFSLEHFRGFNYPIHGSFPLFLNGYAFYLAFLSILFRYWLFQKKTLTSFLSACVIILFAHHIFNKGAAEAHLVYAVIAALLLYLAQPTILHRHLLILLDLMAVINLVLFYSFTGQQHFQRLYFGFDITVFFAALYVGIFVWIFLLYLKYGTFAPKPLSNKKFLLSRSITRKF